MGETSIRIKSLWNFPLLLYEEMVLLCWEETHLKVASRLYSWRRHNLLHEYQEVFTDELGHYYT